MSVTDEIQNQWEAFLKLVQVREPKFHEHLRKARIKEITRYNIVLYAKDPDELKEIEVGLKVYHDKIIEFVPVVFNENRGIKLELAPKGEWAVAAPEPVVESPARNTPQSPAASAPPADLTELMRVMESTIRQKVESELRASGPDEEEALAAREQDRQRIKEDLEREAGNRRLAARMALAAKGDKTLDHLMEAWSAAKRTGEGGPQWDEVRKRLLELLDATIQLTHS